MIADGFIGRVVRTTLVFGVLASALLFIAYRGTDTAAGFFLANLAGVLLLFSLTVLARTIDPRVDSQEKMFAAIGGGALNLAAIVGVVMLARWLSPLPVVCGFSLFMVVIILKAVSRVLLGMDGLGGVKPNNEAESKG